MPDISSRYGRYPDIVPDIDDTVSWSLIDPPDHITITEITAFTFEAEASYTNNDLYVGPDSFTYKGTE